VTLNRSKFVQTINFYRLAAPSITFDVCRRCTIDDALDRWWDYSQQTDLRSSPALNSYK